LRCLPENFYFPEATAYTCFKMWHEASPHKLSESETITVPPLRLVKAYDINSKNDKKRLSDWRFLSSSLIAALGDDYCLDCPNPESSVVDAQYFAAVSRIPILNRKQKKKRIRPEDWTVQTTVKELRIASRPK